jgi:Cu/Ag efflux pump CusA
VTGIEEIHVLLSNHCEITLLGLTYLVQYDSTTFVSDTIAEMLKTLGEAFVLVVIVVFLFLGNLRATIIPAVAVPVSLIGVFAVRRGRECRARDGGGTGSFIGRSHQFRE